MPSDSETLGFVVIEAFASGIPVVGVAAGGLVDIIEHGKNGYLAPNVDDMEEFSQHVKTLIDDKQKRLDYGLYARKWAEGWSWEAATSKLRNIQYRTAMRLHRSKDMTTGDYIVDIEEALLSHGNKYRPDLS
jgi:sulfoquinovosyltransferase